MARTWLATALTLVLTGALSSRASRADDAVDFGRDVQPLFKAHCYECHGPKQQKNGFRLDRRRDALRGGTITMIGPGHSAASRLYLKLVSDQYGQRMPPTGPLDPEQLNIIKLWIDQGAKWPDDLAGETAAAPPDPQAARMMELLRDGDHRALQTMLSEDRRIASLKGPGGSTPLMYAVLYGDADAVRLLLDNGADPNVRNEVGASALMWAADDLEKTRWLLERGAEVNARSDDGRTALAIAASRFGSLAVVRLLLDSGADPSVRSPSYKGPLTPLREAADVGDEAVVRLLIERGADVKSAGPLPLIAALNANDARCVDLLMPSADRATLSTALASLGPPNGNPAAFGNAKLIQRLLDDGADVNARGRDGRRILMDLANSDSLPLESVTTLLERGADTNTRTEAGQTALDFALQRGQTPVVDLLVKAGAKPGGASPVPVSPPKPAGSVRAALSRTIPLLQRSDIGFVQKTGCVSCHHNSLTAMTIAAARSASVPVDDQVARAQRASIASYIDVWRERALQGLGIPGDADTVGYVLIGMAAEKHPPDAATDALARYVKSRQLPDGGWRPLGHRPPLESSAIQVTAASLRALQVYAPRARRSEYEKSIERAKEWLKRARATTTEDRAFQLLGLRWAGDDQEILLRKAASDLLSEQRADGGWGELPSLASDAYATGQALVALKEAGAVAATDAAYQRGVEFLLSTQLEDGSWYVRSRSIPFQPYFESGFPHGHDQWISAAATNWAAMALVAAAGP
ncbi:MAG TPA: ankyrin repeat domain-containing protein [Pirellulales bacterium]|nr:ankyrin repeat domain-containing protein [Pirellulales bacterium]